MIKMTKRGQCPAERPYRGTCSTCKSEYEALQGDLKQDHDFRDTWYTAHCELCQAKVYYTRVR